MATRKFDRFMIDVNIGASHKLMDLTPAERWAFVAGVLSLAAVSPVRGRLLIGDVLVRPEHVAKRADVPVAVARTAMEKLRLVGSLVPDEELACEQVHDFDQWNPGPRNDPTNADRQARYRAKRNAALRNGGNGGVTDDE